MTARPALSFDDVAGAIPRATALLLERVVAKADDRGVEVHLVGGPVRDLLLGRALEAEPPAGRRARDADPPR